jgi:hypothetical protein
MKIVFTVLFTFILLSTTAFAAEECFFGPCDTDNDGLTNGQETDIYYTDPLNADTDGDGFSDGVEVENGYSPRHGENKRFIDVDSDSDELNDYWELKMGTDLMQADTDGDSYADGVEMATSHDPLDDSAEIKERLIQVNIADQYLSYYFGDKLIDGFAISSGVSGMDTPEGQFTVLDKQPVKHYGGGDYDYPNTKWNMHFTTRYYRYWIHGAYWHDNFGQPMSHGCVNVDYENMEPLYDWSQVGTKVIIN